MKIAVIGASKGIGLCCVKRALASGYRVNALSRSGVDIAPSDLLRNIKGSALEPAELSHAIEGVDAILVTLGTGGHIRKTTLFSAFAQTLLSVHKKNPIHIPVIVLTGFGTGESVKYHPWYTRIPFRTVLGRVYDDKEIMERMISLSGLNWEIVRPWIMSNAKCTGNYRIAVSGFEKFNMLPIPRCDVADFMVEQAADPTYLLQYPALFHK